MNAIARLGTFFGIVFTTLFGRWTAPGWMRWSGLQMQRAGAASAVAARARPRVFGAGALAVIALAVGGYYGHAWWKARPQPVTASLAASYLGIERMGLAMGMISAGHALCGALGAFLGGYLFRTFGFSAGSGMLGSIIVATVGAIVLLLLLRLVRRAR